MNWTEIIIASLGGGTLITGIFEVVKSVVDKRKTPYDMLMGMLEEQKKFYQDRNADYEREKLDSAEKSSVIMQTHFCKHKYTDPNIACPVDIANDTRLKKRCERCAYVPVSSEQDADEPK